ncbi:unnamed protein product [Oikopleura dioica]|uniref:Uncharacterized protein n=1 Tax=Oikopleura dioica TaxID=34765 RepID=E4XLA0_OIKDI|nr:unnamed protein product [Oikopleura dioica]
MSHSKMSKPRDGQWAWNRFRNDPELWIQIYHGNPFEHLHDPRVADQNQPEPTTSLLGGPPPTLLGTAEGNPDPASVQDRVQHDSELYGLVFGRLTQRPSSPDTCFRNPEGEDTLDLQYRTAPMADFCPYVERKPEHQLHFDVLNETQLRIFLTAEAKASNSTDWFRAGYCYSEYHGAEQRKRAGDLSNTDHQGLEYNFRLRVLENTAGPVAERFTPAELEICEYIISSLMYSTDPRSRFFRRDLLRLNEKNNLSLQSFGMQVLTGTRQFVDSHGISRNESPSEVVLRLSKFGNFVPLQAHREIFRKVMGKDQNLTVDDYLLNPVDAGRLGTSLLIMPRYQRDLLILQGVYGGASHGTLMATTTETTRSFKSFEFCLASSDIPSTETTDRRVTSLQQSTDRLSETSRRSASAKAQVYRAAHSGLPSLSVKPGIAHIPDVETEAGSDAPTSSSLLSVPSQTDHSTLPDSAPSTDSNSVNFAAYDELDAEFPEIRTENLPLHKYSSWVFLLHRARSLTHESMDASSLGASPPPTHPSVESYEIPVIHGCVTDPRNSDYVYDSANEVSDNSILQIGPIGSDRPAAPPFRPPPEAFPLTNSQRRKVIAEFGRLQKFGDPGPMSDSESDLSSITDISLASSANSQRHLKDLLWNFQQRILQKGTRLELFYLAMSDDTAGFLGHARCLQRLTPQQKRAVIGPFTTAEKLKFQQRFNPTRQPGTPRHEVFEALYQLQVPDTSEDFTQFVSQDPPPPAFAYIAAREARESRPVYQEPLRSDQLVENNECGYPTESIASTASFGSEPETISQLPGVVQMPDPETWPHQPRHRTFLDQLSAMPEPEEPQDFDGYLNDIHEALHYDPLRLSPDDFDPPNELVAAQFQTPISKWFSGQQLSREFTPPQTIQLDLQSQLDGSEAPRIAYYDQPGYLVFPHDNLADPEPPVRNQTRTVLRKQQKIADAVPEETTLADYEANVTYFTTVPVPSRQRRCLFVCPPTVVPCFAESHTRGTRSAARSKRQVPPRTHQTYLVHPILAQCVSSVFDFTADFYQLYHHREVTRWQRDGFVSPTQLPKEYPPSLPTVADKIQLDPATTLPFFPAGTVSKLLKLCFIPRTASDGYRALLESQIDDKYSKTYPQILKKLRGNVNSDHISAQSLEGYGFHEFDRRFSPQSDSHPAILSPQLFIEKIPFLEPSMFAPSSRRHWCLLLPDVDSHSWGPLSSFTILCGRAETLQRLMSLCAPEKIPVGRAGIQYLQASRPGVPNGFALTMAIGGVRPYTPRSILPKISPRWNLKLSARLNIAFFQGLVERVTLAQAQAKGINGDEYQRVLADLENVDKYYETVTDHTGSQLRRRRRDVYPPSLVGLHRPIYSTPKKIGAEPRLLYFERILWPGAGFISKVLNTTPNVVTKINGREKDTSTGGPRLILVHRGPIEKEFLECFLALPAFFMQQSDRIYTRCREDNPGSPELLREFSLSPLTFSPDMCPPLWTVRLHRLQNFLGRDFYLAAEQVIHHLELDHEVYPLSSFSPDDDAYLKRLCPYRVPHLEPQAESLVRVDSNGTVVYRAEELQEIQEASETMPTDQPASVSSVGTCYARHVAAETRDWRPLYEEPSEGNNGILSRKTYVRLLDNLP